MQCISVWLNRTNVCIKLFDLEICSDSRTQAVWLMVTCIRFKNGPFHKEEENTGPPSSSLAKIAMRTLGDKDGDELEKVNKTQNMLN